MEIPTEISDKILAMLEKVGLSSDLTSKVKEELNKGGVSITKVEVIKPEFKYLSSEEIDKMDEKSLRERAKSIPNENNNDNSEEESMNPMEKMMKNRIKMGKY